MYCFIRVVKYRQLYIIACKSRNIWGTSEHQPRTLYTVLGTGQLFIAMSWWGKIQLYYYLYLDVKFSVRRIHVDNSLMMDRSVHFSFVVWLVCAAGHGASNPRTLKLEILQNPKPLGCWHDARSGNVGQNMCVCYKCFMLASSVLTSEHT